MLSVFDVLKSPRNIFKIVNHWIVLFTNKLYPSTYLSRGFLGLKKRKLAISRLRLGFIGNELSLEWLLIVLFVLVFWLYIWTIWNWRLFDKLAGSVVVNLFTILLFRWNILIFSLTPDYLDICWGNTHFTWIFLCIVTWIVLWLFLFYLLKTFACHFSLYFIPTRFRPHTCDSTWLMMRAICILYFYFLNLALFWLIYTWSSYLSVFQLFALPWFQIII